MSRRQREEFLEAATQLADQLSALDDELSLSELKTLLLEAGSDPDALLGRFYAAARDLESKSWANGKTPPAHLRRLASRGAAPGTLPTDPAAALAKVKEWLERFREGITPSVEPAELQVLRAYRKDGDVSSKDAALLDRLEQELKARLSGPESDE